jgi:hypothetical protein
VKFDLDVGNALQALHVKNVMVFEGCSMGLFTAEGLGLDPNPKSDGTGRDFNLKKAISLPGPRARN